MRTVSVFLFPKKKLWVSEGTDSCLHIAVRQVNLEMVDLLLRSGADPKLVNGDYKAPEKSVADVTAPEKIKDLEQITALFGSLKDKKFRRRVPPLLPVREFKIFLTPNCENSKFAKKFNITTQLEFATHIIVKTDEDGVFEPDDNYIDNIMMMFE